MVQDQPREGRQLPGAMTSEEERAGLEPILIQILDGQIEPELTVAPEGDVRIVAMNRGEEAAGVHIGREQAADSAVFQAPEVAPGDAAESVVHLEAGTYVVTVTDPRGESLSTATLTVQPQQGLPGSAEEGASDLN